MFAMQTFARAAQLAQSAGDQPSSVRILAKMHRLYTACANQGDPPDGIHTFHLWDADHGLFYQNATWGCGDPHCVNLSTPNGARVLWSRGNGWAAAGLVRALASLPLTYPHREEYALRLQELAHRLLELQQSDGCWRSSLEDTQQYPNPETSGTALFTYAFAWASLHGVLPAAKFLPAINRGWGCIANHTTAAGLGWCQPGGTAPAGANGNSTFAFCVGSALLAAEQVMALSRSQTSPASI